jgi:hypothetical protein
VVVKVEGMGQEEAAVVAVAVRGGAGNDLPPVFLLDDFPSQRYPNRVIVMVVFIFEGLIN